MGGKTGLMQEPLEVPDDETIPFQNVTARDVFKRNSLSPPYPHTFLGEGKGEV